MPGWITHTDKDGNRYFVDKNLKLWTSEKPDYKYKVVTTNGLDYYLAQGKALINHHYKVEGLTLLKSVRLLADHYSHAMEAAEKASHFINLLKKKEGSRFLRINQLASILMLKKNNETYIYNDLMRYSVKVEGKADVLKKKIIFKHNYIRYGFMIGINFSKKNIKNEKYDLLMLINSEKFHYNIPIVDKYEKICKNKLPGDRFVRKLEYHDNFKKKYVFSEQGKISVYKGYELFILNGKIAYFIRIIADKKGFVKNKDKIDKIINTFKISKSP